MPLSTYLLTYLPTFLPTYLPTYLPYYLPSYLHSYIPSYVPTFDCQWLHIDTLGFFLLKPYSFKENTLYQYERIVICVDYLASVTRFDYF